MGASHTWTQTLWLALFLNLLSLSTLYPDCFHFLTCTFKRKTDFAHLAGHPSVLTGKLWDVAEGLSYDELAFQISKIKTRSHRCDVPHMCMLELKCSPWCLLSSWILWSFWKLKWTVNWVWKWLSTGNCQRRRACAWRQRRTNAATVATNPTWLLGSARLKLLGQEPVFKWCVFLGMIVFLAPCISLLDLRWIIPWHLLTVQYSLW